MKNITWKNFTEEEFKKIIQQCTSKTQLILAMGWPVGGSAHRRINQLIKDYNVDISHFKGKGWSKDLNTYTIPLENILKKDIEYSSNSLKKRLIKEGILGKKCACCGATEWNNEEIPLDLHHINGDHYDNRLENLQLLCPNCHKIAHRHTPIVPRIRDGIKRAQAPEKVYKTQLEKEHRERMHLKYLKRKERQKLKKEGKINDKKTDKTTLIAKICKHCGKEFYVKEKYASQQFCSYDCLYNSRILHPEINREKMIQLFIEHKSYKKVGAALGFSDNTVRTYCKKMNLPTKRDEMEIFLREYNK